MVDVGMCRPRILDARLAAGNDTVLLSFIGKEISISGVVRRSGRRSMTRGSV
jgi:hypothetical protein